MGALWPLLTLATVMVSFGTLTLLAAFRSDESCQPIGWASAAMIPSGPRT
jgi:hypothetical protein